MPYLPAKDELVSLDRLSSWGLWKWYNSKGFGPATIWRGAAFHFLAVFSKMKILWKLWLWFSKMFHQRVRCDWKWSISKFQFWQRILDIYRQPLLRSDDRDDSENVKKSKRFNNQNNFSRESRFFVHFFAVTERLRRENAFFQRKYTSDEISSLFLNLDMVLRNSTFRRAHLHLTKLVTWSNR